MGFKHSFAEVLDLKIAAAYGKHQFANSPNLLLYTEPSTAANEAGFDQGFKSFGQSNIKGYYLANGPQQAYSLGLQYNDPDYWRINLTGNYFSHAYLQPNPLRRTASFLTDPQVFCCATTIGRIIRSFCAKSVSQRLLCSMPPLENLGRSNAISPAFL